MHLISMLMVLYLPFGGSIYSQPIVRPLLATEWEVDQFFEKYTERSMKKDVEGVLTFFSSKAIQNGREIY